MAGLSLDPHSRDVSTNYMAMPGGSSVPEHAERCACLKTAMGTALKSASIAHPVYEGFNKLLMDSYGFWLLGLNPVAAVAIGGVLASCDFWFQWKYITEQAFKDGKDPEAGLGERGPDYYRGKLQQIKEELLLRFKSELAALAGIGAALAEAIEFATGMYIALHKKDFNALITFSGAFAAFMFRFRKELCAEVRHAFKKMDDYPDFEQTFLGNLVISCGRIPGVINFDNIVRLLQRPFEALVHQVSAGTWVSVHTGSGILGLLAFVCAGAGTYCSQAMDERALDEMSASLNHNPPRGLEHVFNFLAGGLRDIAPFFSRGCGIYDAVLTILSPVEMDVLNKALSQMSMGLNAADELGDTGIEFINELSQTFGFGEIEGNPIKDNLRCWQFGLGAATFLAGIGQCMAKLPDMRKALTEKFGEEATRSFFGYCERFASMGDSIKQYWSDFRGGRLRGSETYLFACCARESNPLVVAALSRPFATGMGVDVPNPLTGLSEGDARQVDEALLTV